MSYPVSRDCPPADDELRGTTSLRVPLTTGASELTPSPGGDADRPCLAPDGGAGVPPQPNNCQSSCDAACTGDACAVQEPDSATGAFICIDARGGVGQVCCSAHTAQPCFATPVARTGYTEAPVPPWPGPSYPKTSKLEAVGTFCDPPANADVINAVIGLPGPAAIVVPAAATWRTPVPCMPPPTGGGGPPAPY